MSKIKYSLILDDAVVRHIDNTARKNKTSRSGLINKILAEYLSYTTPETHINEIMRRVGEIFGAEPDFVKVTENSERLFSVKTPLDCKYNPTIRYRIELFPSRDGNAFGELQANYRIRSRDVASKLDRFFALVAGAENKYFSRPNGCSVCEGKFSRKFFIPDGKDYTDDETAEAITAYVKNFDSILKDYLLEHCSDEQTVSAYRLCILNTDNI